MRVIHCAGEQGRVVLDILRALGEASNLVFVDDDDSLHDTTVDGVPVVGSLRSVSEVSERVECLVAYGDQRGVRLDIAERIENAGYDFFEAVHPDTTVSATATIKHGVVVNGQSYVGPGAYLSEHTLVDSGVSLSHDVILRPGATVTPGATVAGGVELGKDSYVGPNATIVEDTTVGPCAVVGAGAVVTESVPPETTVVGVPAEPI